MKKQQAPVQAQLRKYLYQKAAHNKVPLSGTFELTPRCNMNCRMCYIRMSEAEMRARGREYTAEEWIEMGKACAKEGMLFLLPSARPLTLAVFPGQTPGDNAPSVPPLFTNYKLRCSIEI